ncbi:MAG: helix-turn-helix transcriptional regulator [Nitrospirales bacterium]|nr:helix-turn-helix transcriptional regulator [Nitrospirales bacterium]
MRKKRIIEIPDLSALPFSGALAIAYSLTELTHEEIAEKMGKGIETIRRWFNPEDDYNPPIPLLPKLCRVIGNTIVIEWICEHADGHYVHTVCNHANASLDVLIAELVKEFSDVLKANSAARLTPARDGSEYHPAELEKMSRELEELIVKAEQVKHLIAQHKERLS